MDVLLNDPPEPGAAGAEEEREQRGVDTGTGDAVDAVQVMQWMYLALHSMPGSAGLAAPVPGDWQCLAKHPHMQGRVPHRSGRALSSAPCGQGPS